jgi:hypothetical protein
MIEGNCDLEGLAMTHSGLPPLVYLVLMHGME